MVNTAFGLLLGALAALGCGGAPDTSGALSRGDATPPVAPIAPVAPGAPGAPVAPGERVATAAPSPCLGDEAGVASERALIDAVLAVLRRTPSPELDDYAALLPSACQRALLAERHPDAGFLALEATERAKLNVQMVSTPLLAPFIAAEPRLDRITGEPIIAPCTMLPQRSRAAAADLPCRRIDVAVEASDGTWRLMIQGVEVAGRWVLQSLPFGLAPRDALVRRVRETISHLGALLDTRGSDSAAKYAATGLELELSLLDAPGLEEVRTEIARHADTVASTLQPDAALWLRARVGLVPRTDAPRTVLPRAPLASGTAPQPIEAGEVEHAPSRVSNSGPFG